MNDQAPWFENTYFDTPKVSIQGIGAGGGWHKVLTANIRRVGVIFSCGAATTIYLSTDNTILAGNTPGLALTATQGILMFSQKDWGPLPSLDWYAVAGVAGELTIVELLLREWPRKQPWIIVNPPEST